MTTQSSDEAKVRQKWPEAMCIYGISSWLVIKQGGAATWLGRGGSALAAWADAARRIDKEAERDRPS